MDNVKTNAMAVASMVLCIIGALSCCGTIIPLMGYGCLAVQFIFSLLAVILGIMGRRQIANSGGTEKGSGFALAGIITGSIFLLLFGFWLLLVFLGVAANVIAFVISILGELN